MHLIGFEKVLGFPIKVGRADCHLRVRALPFSDRFLNVAI